MPNIINDPLIVRMVTKKKLGVQLERFHTGGGGSGGTSYYNDLMNKPQINGITLIGDQSGSDLGLDESFVATYGETTIAEMNAAYEAGKNLYCRYAPDASGKVSIFPLFYVNPNSGAEFYAFGGIWLSKKSGDGYLPYFMVICNDGGTWHVGAQYHAKTGNLSDLTTDDKTSLVAAINEIDAHLASIEEEKEYSIGENIIYNGMPHIGFTSMGNSSITGWLGARASTSVDAEGLSGKYFNIKYPVGVTSDQGLFQFQKYMIRNGEEGNGSEINIINSGDTVSVSFEINTNVSLEHIYFRTACSVYNGTTPSIVYCVNAESDVTNDKWVRFDGSCVIPDWWDSKKTSADTKHLGFILEIKPGSDLDGTVEKSVKIRNIKLEFGETPTSFIPSIMDFSDISSKACTLPLEKGSGNKSVQVINTGNENNASGVASFAGGGRSTASGQMSIAFGSYSSSYPTGPVASGAASVAIGLASQATGNYAIAAGQVAEASGGSSVAMGYHTVASGSRSVAMGQNTEANATGAAAFGNLTKATGDSSFVIGQANVEDTNPVDTTHGSEARKYLFTIGNGTDDTHRSNALTVDWNGNEEIQGDLTVFAGSANELNVGEAILASPFEPGTGNDSAILKETSGNSPCEASGSHSFAAGVTSIASGTGAAAFGQRVSGTSSTASGTGSFSAGGGAVASGGYSQAFGQKTQATGSISTAFGNNTIASGRASFVSGQYNIEDTNPVDTTHGSGARKYIFIIGNGINDNSRSNALTIDWDGNEELAGSLTLGKGTADEVTITPQQIKALLALLN